MITDIKNINLFIIIPNLEMGGSERVIITLLRHFDASIFNITFIVLTKVNDELLSSLPTHIKFLHLGKKTVLSSLPHLISLIRRKKPDIVFSNLNHLNLALCVCSVFLPRRTQLVARESTIISANLHHYRYPHFWALLFRIFYRNFAKIVCQSSAMQHDLVENFNVRAEKTIIVNNPLDIKTIKKSATISAVQLKQNPDDQRVQLVSVGRFRPEKRFDRLVEAIAFLNSDLYHLTCVGDGSELETVKAQVAELGLNSQISFVGFQKNPYPYIQAADALILSSDYEGAPNVVLEALGLNIAVVTTPAKGGVAEMVADHKRAVMADALTAVSLGKAIAEARKSGLFAKDTTPDNQIAEKHDAAAITKIYEQQFIELSS